MDFSRAARAITTDAEWLPKVLIGGVLSLLSVLILPALVILGYQVETMGRAARGDDRLPTWDDVGGYLVRGGLAVVIQLVYALPLLFLICCIMAAAMASGNDPTAQSDATGALVACLACLAFFLGLAAAFVAPAAQARFAAANDIAAAFDVGAVLRFIGDNLGEYAVAFVANIVLGLAAAAVSLLLCGVPAPWLSFVAGVIGYHLYGQVARPRAGTVAPVG